MVEYVIYFHFFIMIVELSIESGKKGRLLPYTHKHSNGLSSYFCMNLLYLLFDLKSAFLCLYPCMNTELRSFVSLYVRLLSLLT